MLRIFKYKSLYLDTCNVLAVKQNKLNNASNKINQLKQQLELEEQKSKQQLEIEKQKLDDYKKESQEQYLLLLDNSNKRVQAKEKLRRKNAGKVGALQKKNNELLKEKQEMLDLINKLIAENQKLKKTKKKPTIDEMRRYFKKN